MICCVQINRQPLCYDTQGRLTSANGAPDSGAGRRARRPPAARRAPAPGWGILPRGSRGLAGGWQNTLAAGDAEHDGEGHRVASNGVTPSTTDELAGGLEEVTTAGSTTTLTKYERVPGVCNVVLVGSGPSEAISYVATDGLDSVSEALDGNGNVTAQQLYGPYGGVRSSSDTPPTAKRFTRGLAAVELPVRAGPERMVSPRPPDA